MNKEDAGQWHMIRTAPQREFHVNDLLSDFGLTVYAPFERVPRAVNKYTKAKRERRRFVTRPVLRGYVFVALPEGDDRAYRRFLFTLYRLKLIRGLVGMEKRARALFSDNIETLRQIYGPGYDRHKDKDRCDDPSPLGLMQTGKEFAIGDVVGLYDGPLSEIDLIVTEIQDAQATMLMTIFGQEREVHAPVADLVKKAV